MILTPKMKPTKIIVLVVCIAVALGIAMIVTVSLGEVLENQQERNYNRFVTNVDGLTNTFRQPVEECVQQTEFTENDCIKKTVKEYQIQFGTLIKLFGYEQHIEELYKYWEADLRYWYEMKKLKDFEQNSELSSQGIQSLEEYRQKNINARLDSGFAQKIESGQ
jgi:hypothetical protein